MNNPTTHTTATKPTAMEKVKEKATQLADKLTGKQHDTTHSGVEHRDDFNQPGPGFHGSTTDNTANPAATYHAGQHPIDALNTDNRRHDRHDIGTAVGNIPTTMPLHTGAAGGDTAVPHGAAVDRSAYQQQLGGTTSSTGPNVPPKDDHSHHHGILSGLRDKHDDKHGQHHTTADPNLIHPSIVPHQQTTNVAGPTGTSHVPAYNQNMPSTAPGGAVPHTAEQVFHPMSGTGADTTGVTGSNIRDTSGMMGGADQHDLYNRAHIHAQTAAMNPGSTTSAAGTQVPMNTNNSTLPINQQNMHQTNPVHSDNSTTTGAANSGGVPQTVPAMGAPGTTTAAGTHMPGQYVA
jgi:hypothetical protein